VHRRSLVLRCVPQTRERERLVVLELLLVVVHLLVLLTQYKFGLFFSYDSRKHDFLSYFEPFQVVVEHELLGYPFDLYLFKSLNLDLDLLVPYFNCLCFLFKLILILK